MTSIPFPRPLPHFSDLKWLNTGSLFALATRAMENIASSGKACFQLQQPATKTAIDPASGTQPFVFINGIKLAVELGDTVYNTDDAIAKQQEHSHNTVADLETIKDHLALTVTQLAELFGVTRKSVYDWYEGAAPRASMLLRIEAMKRLIAARRSSIDFRKLKTVWHIPISGSSFLVTLNDDHSDRDRNSLETHLASKLDELHSLMVAPDLQPRSTETKFNSGSLVEFERHGNFK